MTTPSKIAHILLAYAEDVEVEIECYSLLMEVWIRTSIEYCIAHQDMEFRLKPKRITIGELSFPEPLRSAPKSGSYYWVSIPFYEMPRRATWAGDTSDFNALNAHSCQATEQGAIEQRAAIVAACGGQP